jgi:hypothetical protein
VLTRITRPVAQLPVGGILVEVVSHGTTIVVPRGVASPRRSTQGERAP